MSVVDELAALDEFIAETPAVADAAASAVAESLTKSPTPAAPAMVDPASILRADPSAPPYPRGLVLDIALKTAPITQLLSAYGLTVEEFKALATHPVFRQDLQDVRDKLREEGFSFRVKLQAQAEVYLAEAFRLVHNPDTPANVKADLIKWSVKAAGLEQQTQAPSAQQIPQMMVDQLKEMPDGELEMKVMSVVLRQAKSQAYAPPTVEGETYESA